MLSNSQQLYFSSYSKKMSDLPIEKQKFIERLEHVCLIIGVDLKRKQTLLAQMFNLKQPSVRKWFTGESVPSYEYIVELCKKSKVAHEWLMTGRGPKFVDLSADLTKDYEIASLIQTAHILRETGRDYELSQLVKIGNTFVEPHPKAANSG